jgi:hypothetical protein
MSGGHFDYNQYRIQNIADHIEQLVAANDTEQGFQFSPEVVAQFRNAVSMLRIAQIYAQRVDWLVCGDDGEQQFLERLDSDLRQHALDQLTALSQSQGLYD